MTKRELSSAAPLRCHCWVVAPPSVPIAVDAIAGYDLDVPIPACSHVVCTQCGADVSHRDAGAVREYRCACATWIAEHPENPTTNDDRPGFDLPWACGGHPVRALPTSIDGVEISGATLLVDLLRAAVARTSSRPPHYWMRRVMRMLEGTPLQSELVAPSRGALVDPEPRVRWLALHLVWGMTDATGVRPAGDAIRSALAERPDLFVGVPRPYPERGSTSDATTLEDEAVNVLSWLCTRAPDESWQRSVREHALRRPVMVSVLEHLAQLDMEWLLASTKPMIDASDDEALPLRLFHAIAVAAPVGKLSACLDRVDVRVVRAAAPSRESRIEEVFVWMLDRDRAWAAAHLAELLACSNYGRAASVLLPGLLARGAISGDDAEALARANSASFVEKPRVKAPPAHDPTRAKPTAMPVAPRVHKPSEVMRWKSPPGDAPVRGIMPVNVTLTHALQIVSALFGELGAPFAVPAELVESDAFVDDWLRSDRGRVAWSDGDRTLAVAFCAVHYDSGPENEPSDEIQCTVEARGLDRDGWLELEGTHLHGGRSVFRRYRIEGTQAQAIARRFFALGERLASWEVF